MREGKGSCERGRDHVREGEGSCERGEGIM